MSNAMKNAPRGNKSMTKKEQARKVKEARKEGVSNPVKGLPLKLYTPGPLQKAAEKVSIGVETIVELGSVPLPVPSEPVDPPSPITNTSSEDSLTPKKAPQGGVDLAAAGTKDESVEVLPLTESERIALDMFIDEAERLAVKTDVDEISAYAEAAIRVDNRFLLFKTYLQRNWSPTTVSVQIGTLASTSPTSMIHPDLWTFARGSISLPTVIYKRMMNDDFLLRVWPALKIAMGTYITNLEWSAGIATNIACCEVITDLPIIKQALEDAIEKDKETEDDKPSSV